MGSRKDAYVIEDTELGPLHVQINPRARRYVFTTKSDGVYVSVPSGTPEEEVRKAIEMVRAKLLSAREQLPYASSERLIDLNFSIDTEHFKLSLKEGTNVRFLANSEFGKMEILCPPGADFADKSLQEWLHKVIDEALRRNAKALLLPQLYNLSVASGLKYSNVKINSSRGRWGSCSTRKSVNLSFYVVLLPQHLIDYVLLHELCHTVEMNHGPRFWALLDKHTNGRALALCEELKRYQTTY
jgi:predicted metal-dependent hydrolase